MPSAPLATVSTPPAEATPPAEDTVDWTARLISPEDDFAGAPLLRTEFTLEPGHGPVTAAVLHATAHGVFEAHLNGARVGDDVLSPGWSSYEWRLRYRSYDVTDLLAVGADPAPIVLGLALGNGWYRGRLGWSGGRDYYGDELGALAQLEITYADGHGQRVVTDTDWRAGPSAVTANDLYDGQDVDARLASDDWLRPGFAADGWVGVHVGERDLTTLEPYSSPPVRRVGERVPERIWTSPSGRTLVDFGQNLVGWVRFTVQGPAGSVITLRHAEVLEHEELGTRPLRSAKATDRLTLSGDEDFFEPTLTFHGFRYLEVDGWPGELTADDLTAVVVSTDLERIGTFECSDELLNRLHRNVVWGARGNFVDVPTDCPQRDERLGWTGDLAAFAPTAVYLFDASDFLRDWLRDLDAEQQHADGMVPFVVPDVLKYLEHPPEFPAPDSTAVWSDAAVWVTWAVYQAYGDVSVLSDAYGAMAAHVRRVASKVSPTGLWDTGFQFGDWLDPTAPPEDAARAKADPGVVATACLVRSADLVAESARLLGRDEDATFFADLAARTRAAFVEHYVLDDGARGVPAAPPPPPRRGVRRHLGAPPRHPALRRRHRLRSGDRLRRAGRGADGPSRRPVGGVGRRGRSPHPDRLRRHPVRDRRPHAHRPPRRRLPVAAADGVPVVALPGDHGRDDHLGALGLDAAGRHHQPRRDDQLQPLRPGCGGRLDAPHDRRHRPRRARLPPGPGRTSARRRHRLGPLVAADTVRRGGGVLDRRPGRAHARHRGAGRGDRGRRAAGRTRGGAVGWGASSRARPGWVGCDHEC